MYTYSKCVLLLIVCIFFLGFSLPSFSVDPQSYRLTSQEPYSSEPMLCEKLMNDHKLVTYVSPITYGLYDGKNKTSFQGNDAYYSRLIKACPNFWEWKPWWSPENSRINKPDEVSVFEIDIDNDEKKEIVVQQYYYKGRNSSTIYYKLELSNCEGEYIFHNPGSSVLIKYNKKTYVEAKSDFGITIRLVTGEGERDLDFSGKTLCFFDKK